MDGGDFPSPPLPTKSLYAVVVVYVPLASHGSGTRLLVSESNGSALDFFPFFTSPQNVSLLFHHSLFPPPSSCEPRLLLPLMPSRDSFFSRVGR